MPGEDEEMNDKFNTIMDNLQKMVDSNILKSVDTEDEAFG